MMADDMGIGDTSAYLSVQLSPASPPITKTLHTRPEAIHKIGDCVHRQLCTSLYVQCGATLYSLVVSPIGHIDIKGGSPHGPNTPMIQKG